MSATAAGADWDYTIKLTDTGTGPIGTYGGAPFSDAGLKIVVSSVPEPSTLVLGIVGLASVLALRLRRKKAQ